MSQELGKLTKILQENFEFEDIGFPVKIRYFYKIEKKLHIIF